MAVLTLPAGAQFTRRGWVPPARVQVNRSMWTGAARKLRLPGAGLWRGSFTLRDIPTQAGAWPWKAWLAALEGNANTFLMPFAPCQQTQAANPVVMLLGDLGVMGSERAVIAGMPPNARFLRAGQGLSFAHSTGRQLVVLTADLMASDDGRGTANFRGALRKSLVEGQAVEARNPVCEMEMLSVDGGWNEEEGLFKLAFDAMESFTP